MEPRLKTMCDGVCCDVFLRPGFAYSRLFCGIFSMAAANIFSVN